MVTVSSLLDTKKLKRTDIFQHENMHIPDFALCKECHENVFGSVRLGKGAKLLVGY